MTNWDSVINNDITNDPAKQGCNTAQDLKDAQMVCQQLKLALYEINFVQEYWKKVFQPFLEQYKNGLTPNPDVLCNRYIKFGVFLDFCLKKFNVTKIATGHYAKVIYNYKNKTYELHRALDSKKDQTYFLSRLTQNQLAKVIFPLADLTKKEVRTLATKHNLTTANKKDSTGICFIGERNFSSFLSNYLIAKPGRIIDLDSNQEIGTHKGVIYYTIGQRKNIGLSGMPEPYYVAGKSIKENILYVASKNNQKWLLSDECTVKEVNLNNPFFDLKKPTTVKFRYRQQDVLIKKLIYNKDQQTIKIKYETTKAVAPGQEAVFYQGTQCIGGGRIEQVYANNKKIWYLFS